MKAHLPFLLLVLSSLPAFSQDQPFCPGLPSVAYLYPRGAKPSEATTLSFAGQYITKPLGFLADCHDGLIPAEFSQPAEKDGKPSRDNQGNSKWTAKLNLPADFPTGIHSFRLITSGGASEPIPFSIHSLPMADEVEANDKNDANNTRESAQVTEPNKTINGILNGPDTDCYRLQLKKDQSFSIDLECFRLALDSEDGTEVSVSLLDAKGKTIATADDSALHLIDPHFTTKIPEDGDYTLELKLSVPSPTIRRVPYRLHQGDFARPAAIFPPGGKPGAKEKVQFLDANGKAFASKEITWPTKLGTTFFAPEPNTPGGNAIRVQDFPSFPETEPNDGNTPPQSISPEGPFAIHGILEKPGDVDNLTFPAKPGRYVVRVFAQALGSPADIAISLAKGDKADAKGEKADDSNENDLDLFENGFLREKLDPRLIFNVKDQAPYTLTIRDTREGGSPLHFYRVEIAPATNGILAGFSAAENNVRLLRSSAHVPQGGTSMHWLQLRPLYGTDKLEGEFQLAVSGLPTGVTMQPVRFRSDKRRLPLIFEATMEAQQISSQLRFSAQKLEAEGKAGDAIPLTFHHLVGQTYVNNEVSNAKLHTALAFSVTAPAPFQLSVAKPDAPLSKQGEISLNIALKRDPAFEKEVEIVLENPPVGIQPAAGFRLEKKQSAGLFRLSGDSNLQPGTYPIRLTARTKVDGNLRHGRSYTVSNEINIVVTEPYVKVQMPRTSLEQGKAEKISLKLTHIAPWPQAAKLNLIRLPKGVSLVEPVSLPQKDHASSVDITLQSAPDALVGTYNGVTMEGIFTVEGQEIKQILGSGTLRIDPARK